tara:strand:- start:1033 stop:1275 length:243 start_codon:yes stop_codon:yes gene_type:complete
MDKSFTYKMVRMYKHVLKETGLVDDDEEKTYKIIPIPPERDEGGLSPIELMSLYEGLIKENEMLRERVLRLEQRLLDVMN